MLQCIWEKKKRLTLFLPAGNHCGIYMYMYDLLGVVMWWAINHVGVDSMQ